MLPSRGNKGGKTEKHERAREEDGEEPSMVASMQAGYMDQMMRDRQKHVEMGVQTPIQNT
jgi:hypothetical protein